MSNLTKENLIRMFTEGKRFDGRKLLETRDIEVSLDVSNQAEGSARIKMGKTDVIVGVKMDFGEPYPDSPDKGNLMVTAELLPLASPRFESGPPGFGAIELGRLVDRSIRESGMLDLSKLVIKEGEKVWTVMVDIYPINDDGNLIDAATIGAMVALKNAVMPGIKENGKVDYDNRTKDKIPLSRDILPIAFSFFKLGENLILDPTREEQEACDSRITFGISKWGGQYMINSGQKVGELPLKREEIENITSMLPEKYEEVMKKLKKFLKE